MHVLHGIACSQGRHNEAPNVELARQLAEARDRKGIREIVEHPDDTRPQVQADCLKVLYEIGYHAPNLVAECADRFLQLLASRNNRLVWGGLIALSTIASRTGGRLHLHRQETMEAIDQGSVITQDSGIQALAHVASRSSYQKALLPYLLRHLSTCRPKDLPLRSEAALAAVTACTKGPFSRVLERRLRELNAAQRRRIQRVVQEAEAQTR